MTRTHRLALACLLALGLVAEARAGEPAPTLPEELALLVAPLAAFPDALIPDILEAATHPTQIAEADQWLAESPPQSERELAHALGERPWDPSVKALTRFPSVLADLDENLDWATLLGEAYTRHSDEVVAAVRALRSRTRRTPTSTAI